MSAFALLRLAHVISAVLAGGLVASVAVIAAQLTTERSEAAVLMVRLTGWASLALGATFLTGLALDVSAGGALHQRWWYRIAGLSMLVCGALIGVVRRRLTRVTSGAAGRAELRGVPWLAFAACTVVVWITVLMELQPF